MPKHQIEGQHIKRILPYNDTRISSFCSSKGETHYGILNSLIIFFDFKGRCSKAAENQTKRKRKEGDDKEN